MARAVSTVMDIAVCLLLVGLAMAALTAAVPSGDQPVETESETVMESLMTATTTVSTSAKGPVHGTMVKHLVHATVVGATIDGEALTESSHPDAVSHEIDRDTPTRTHVTARWEPYPDSPLYGTINVGQKPPSSADIAVTTQTVHAGTHPAPSAAADSFGAIAAEIAETYIARLFPEKRVRTQLVDPRTAHSTAERYRTVAETIGVDIDDELEAASATQANRRLSNVLARQLESDLRSSYETPVAAAGTIETGHVQVTVRRWEP